MERVESHLAIPGVVNRTATANGGENLARRRQPALIILEEEAGGDKIKVKKKMCEFTY